MIERNKKLIADTKRQLQLGVRMRQYQIKLNKGEESTKQKFIVNVALQKIEEYKEAIKALDKEAFGLAFEVMLNILQTKKSRSIHISKELINIIKRLGKANGFTQAYIKIKMF